MTFFLPKRPADEPAPRLDAPQEGGTPNVFESFAAGFEKAQLENDSNFRLNREVLRQSRSIAERAMPLLEGVDEKFTEAGINRRGRDAETLLRTDRKAVALVLDMAREQAAQNPDAWADIDLSNEAIQSNVEEALRSEYQEAVDLLEVTPRPVAEFIGAMAGMTVDVKNAPFLLLGGGAGSFARVAGREALMNTVAEGSFLPSQFKMAEVLDIADPNVPQQLVLAGAAGGTLGVLFEGGRRAAGYFLGRQSVQPLPGYTRAETEALVDEIEDAIQADPLRDVREVTGSEVRPTRPAEALPEPPPAVRAAIVERTGAARLADADIGPIVRPQDFRASTAIPEDAPRTAPIEMTPAVEANVRAQVARERSPEVFEKLDESQARIVEVERQLSSRVAEQDETITDALKRINQDEQRATDALADSRAKARSTWKKELSQIPARRREAIARSAEVEGPEIATLRQQVEDERDIQRLLSGDVARAYRESAPEAQSRIKQAQSDQQSGSGAIAAREIDEAVSGDEIQQSDLFDDPTSPAADKEVDAMLNELEREIADEGDFDIMLEGDGAARPASSVIDDIRQDDEFLEQLQICATGGRVNGAQ